MGFIITEYKTFGLETPLFETSNEWKSFLEYLIWIIIGLSIVDLGLKYNKVKDSKKFVKQYWLDIALLAAIPAFSAFKILKLGISIAKKLKTAKMGIKIIHKTKKVSSQHTHKTGMHYSKE